MNPATSMLPQHPKQEGCLIIPMFSKDGTALTEADRLASAERKGLCSSCGIQTHKLAFPLRKVPLTNASVYQGNCIRCCHLIATADNPCAVPAEIYTAWEQNNPHLVIASSSGSRGAHLRNSGPRRSRTRGGERSLSPIPPHSRRQQQQQQQQQIPEQAPALLPKPMDGSEHGPPDWSTRSAPLRKSAGAPGSGSTNNGTGTPNKKGHRRYHSQGNPRNLVAAAAAATAATTATSAAPPFRKCATTTVLNQPAAAPFRKCATTTTPIRTSVKANQSIPNDDNHLLMATTAGISIQACVALSTPPQRRRSNSHHKTTTPPGCSHQQQPMDDSTSHHHEEEFFYDATSRDEEEEDKPHPFFRKNGTSSRGYVVEEEIKVDPDIVVVGGHHGEGGLQRASTVPIVVTNGIPLEPFERMPSGISDASSTRLLTTENIQEWLQAEDRPPDEVILIANQQDVIKAVIMEMKLNKCNATVQRNGCRLFLHPSCATTADGGERRSEDEICSIINALVSAINCNMGDSVLAEQASWKLDHLISKLTPTSTPFSDDKAEKVIRKATEALVASLDRQQGNLQALQAISQTLCHSIMASSSSTAETVRSVLVEKQPKVSTVLQACMHQHIHDEILQQYACGILKIILMRESEAELSSDTSLTGSSSGGPGEAEEDPMVTLLCLVIDRHRKTVSVQREALECLHYATEQNCVVVEAVVISAVVQAMKAHAKDASVQAFGCGVLRNLSVRKANVNTIVDLNGIDAIVRAMKDDDGENLLQCYYGCRALKHLALDDKIELKILQKGGIGVVVKALERSPMEANLQCEGYAALANLSHSKDSKAMLVRQKGLVAMLVAAMKQHLQDGNVQQKICSVILNLSVSETFIGAFDQLGGIALIAAAMTTHSDDIKLQQNGIGSLKNLCRKGTCNATLVASGAVEAVAQSMTAYGGNLKLQIHAMGFLKNASTHKEIARQIFEVGGHLAIRDAMQMHLYNVSLQQEGCLALMNLSRVKEVAVAIAENGGVPAAIMAMQQHENSAAAQNAGCGLLWNLSAATSKSHALIATERGVESILLAMERHPTAVDVQQKACLCLHNLAPHDGCRAVMEQDGKAIILALTGMRGHHLDGHVQKYACKFLSLMVRADRRHVDVLTANGGLPVVQAALENHRKVDDVQKYGGRIVERAQRALR